MFSEGQYFYNLFQWHILLGTGHLIKSYHNLNDSTIVLQNTKFSSFAEEQSFDWKFKEHILPNIGGHSGTYDDLVIPVRLQLIPKQAHTKSINKNIKYLVFYGTCVIVHILNAVGMCASTWDLNVNSQWSYERHHLYFLCQNQNCTKKIFNSLWWKIQRISWDFSSHFLYLQSHICMYVHMFYWFIYICFGYILMLLFPSVLCFVVNGNFQRVCFDVNNVICIFVLPRQTLASRADTSVVVVIVVAPLHLFAHVHLTFCNSDSDIFWHLSGTRIGKDIKIKIGDLK